MYSRIHAAYTEFKQMQQYNYITIQINMLQNSYQYFITMNKLIINSENGRTCSYIPFEYSLIKYRISLTK